MKVEQSQVTKLIITDVPRHDHIHVYLEDYGDYRGRITVTEYGSSWSCFWGSMGCSLVEFILDISNAYWIGKLAPQLNQSLDSDKMQILNLQKIKLLRLGKKMK
nr:hypothetical protein [Morganella morganii]